METSCWYISAIACPWHPKTHSSVDESHWLILELNAEHISARISLRCIGAFKVLADRFLCESVMGEECQESLSPHHPPPSQIKTMCPWWPGTWFQPVWGFNSFCANSVAPLLQCLSIEPFSLSVIWSCSPSLVASLKHHNSTSENQLRTRQERNIERTSAIIWKYVL